MTFLGHRVWFCLYQLQGFDTGLSTWDSVQYLDYFGMLQYQFLFMQVDLYQSSYHICYYSSHLHDISISLFFQLSYFKKKYILSLYGVTSPPTLVFQLVLIYDIHLCLYVLLVLPSMWCNCITNYYILEPIVLWPSAKFIHTPM